MEDWATRLKRDSALIKMVVQILLLYEPTHGVDVGAKYEICKLINQPSEKGTAVILITSELSELIGLCDRVAGARDGEVSGSLKSMSRSFRCEIRDM